jgi:hypothetical protein
MTTEATILLVGVGDVLTGLMAGLEEAGLFVERSAPHELATAFEVIQPDLVVHVGAPFAQGTVAFLQAEARAHRLVRLVLVGERAELSLLRRLDREIVESVLALDIPLRLIVERIRALGQRTHGNGVPPYATHSTSAEPAQSEARTPPQNPEEKLRPTSM